MALLQVVLLLLTLLVGILLGVMIGDGNRGNKEVERLERRVKALERRMANESNS